MKVVGLLIAVWLAVPALAETRVLLAAGLGGEPDYENEFQRQAQAAAEQMAVVASDLVLLEGRLANRERLRDELAALAARTAPADEVVVVLIGHGSYDERDYRFNLPGTDVTGDELAQWLDAVPASRQLVVAATSASGALQSRLAAEHRTLITATRSGGERNVTVFARYFAQALGDTAADTDKDGYVSSVEAFRFAEAAVMDHYDRRKQMATEHPLLQGAKAPMMLARLETNGGLQPASGAEQVRLADLEAQIAALRADKDNREPDAYYADLQRLLLEVAMLRRRLDAEGGS